MSSWLIVLLNFFICVLIFYLSVTERGVLNIFVGLSISLFSILWFNLKHLWFLYIFCELIYYSEMPPLSLENLLCLVWHSRSHSSFVMLSAYVVCLVILLLLISQVLLYMMGIFISMALEHTCILNFYSA